MLQTPSLEDWLALDTADLAAQVQALNPALSVFISVDGSRRYYLLKEKSDPELKRFGDYTKYSGKALERVFDLLYSHGVQTILNHALIPDNFTRPGNYLTNALKYSAEAYLENFEGLYRKHKVRARLVGDWDIAPLPTEVKHFLADLQADLIKRTPEGEKLLLIGYQARPFNQEMIDRTVKLAQALGRTPTEAEVRRACFPDGPENLNILIEAGWLRIGAILPPLLDSGATDIYNLAFLTFNLDEATLRRILYDHLFQRWVTTDHGDNYAPEDIEKLRAYYDAHQGKLIGLGQLVGPGIWYADHP